MHSRHSAREYGPPRPAVNYGNQLYHFDELSMALDQAETDNRRPRQLEPSESLMEQSYRNLFETPLPYDVPQHPRSLGPWGVPNQVSSHLGPRETRQAVYGAPESIPSFISERASDHGRSRERPPPRRSPRRTSSTSRSTHSSSSSESELSDDDSTTYRYRKRSRRQRRSRPNVSSQGSSHRTSENGRRSVGRALSPNPLPSRAFERDPPHDYFESHHPEPLGRTVITPRRDEPLIPRRVHPRYAQPPPSPPSYHTPRSYSPQSRETVRYQYEHVERRGDVTITSSYSASWAS